MKKLSLVLVFLSLFWNFDSVSATNSDPVVLVHGLGAFAATWMYSREIEDEGMTVFALNVGKITSNWDRACEVYAQLMGTRVDFGVCHSRDFGHERFGVDYTGKALYPNWSEENKLHFWGHSMGASTIRTLERLLREGSGCSEDTSPLFTGGKNLIRSVTSMSGVNAGSTLVELLDNREILDVIKNLVLAFAGLLDESLLDNIYFIDLAHWGLERQEDESFREYWRRVQNSDFMSEDNKDISVYDLSKNGMSEFNNKDVLQYDDTYYFSFATERTKESRDCTLLVFCEPDPIEEREITMLPFLWPTANIIGAHSPADEKKNDGLMNWFNQLCPYNQEEDVYRCDPYQGVWPSGEWVWMDIDYLDHAQIILRDSLNDAFDYYKSAKRLYIEHARRLQALPGN